ncbi:MAG TPA: hypothetical protein VGQ91_11670, partial [Ideonella sp.]|nr:hypothetical protein [Ideonella sp.]
GRDVLVALVEFAESEEHGRSVAGLWFLAAGCTALSLSVWYSMRWLLCAEMPALPLPDPPGWFQRWMPRLMGGLAPAMVAVGLYFRGAGAPVTAQVSAGAFAALAVMLVVLSAWRGDLLLALARQGWIEPPQARDGAQPAKLDLRSPLPGLTLRVIVWSVVLTLIVAVMMLMFRLTLPRVIGAAAVAAIALASINLFGSFVLTYWPLRHGLPPLAVWVLLAAALLGALNDNHEVATVEGSAEGSRLVLDEDFQRFLEEAPKPGGAPPMVLFVASEGGGIRAAYWTAAVLEQLARQSPETFRRQLYALSGVSGGSLGVAAWVMAHRTDYCPELAAQPVAALGSAPRPATASLAMDFAAPAVAGLFYYDFAQRFLPFPVAAFDRSRTIEGAWQNAFAHLPGQPFAQPLDALYRECPTLPRLLLNATVVETGQRAVLGPLALEAEDADSCSIDPLFLNAMPAMARGLATRRQPLAGLVHHSARFPVISPAGTVTRPPETLPAPACPASFRLVDGGYFDNSSTQTVMDLVLRLRAKWPGAFRPVVLLVRNDPSLLCAQQVPLNVTSTGFAPEATSVVSALLNARGSHAVLARAALLREKIDVVDLVVPGDMEVKPPLGWALSDQVRKAMDKAAEGYGTLGLAQLIENSKPCETNPR